MMLGQKINVNQILGKKVGQNHKIGSKLKSLVINKIVHDLEKKVDENPKSFLEKR